MKRETTIAAAVTLAAGFASAGVTTDPNTPMFDGAGYGFEDRAAGSRVDAIDFGNGLVATVSTSGNGVNSVFKEHDGHGAVSWQGEMAWKITNGPFVLDFGGAEVSSFGFWYSDLEGADLHISFDGGDTQVLADNNSRTPKFWAYEAADGASFSTVTIAFTRNNDGVGLDGIFANPVPTPGAAGLLGLGGLALARRRR